MSTAQAMADGVAEGRRQAAAVVRDTSRKIAERMGEEPDQAAALLVIFDIVGKVIETPDADAWKLLAAAAEASATTEVERLRAAVAAAEKKARTLMGKMSELGEWGEQLARIVYRVPEGGFLTPTTFDDLTREVQRLVATLPAEDEPGPDADVLLMALAIRACEDGEPVPHMPLGEALVLRGLCARVEHGLPFTARGLALETEAQRWVGMLAHAECLREEPHESEDYDPPLPRAPDDVEERIDQVMAAMGPREDDGWLELDGDPADAVLDQVGGDFRGGRT